MRNQFFIKQSFGSLFLVFCFCGCSLFNQKKEPLFKKLSHEHTNIHFSNEINYSKEFSVNDFSYLYNGGGVAVGDINNDGLADLYFTGNLVSSRLYLNKGNFQFEDITESSGTGTENWAGGVSMVDINNDGYLDIYVSVTGTENSTPNERKNLLFINNKDNSFTEAAAQYGVDYSGYTTHATFLDYNSDGYLDLFLINNYAGSFSRDHGTGIRDEVNDGSSMSTDALFINNKNGKFTNVSEEAGISKEGYSLGVAVNDINLDGWPDIYVSNDIQTDDLLYINNGDGTFTDKADQYFKHTSYAGMGTDAADFNNDGWPDILQVDMMPPALKDQQLVSGARDYAYLEQLKEKGYQNQYSLNTLQLSNGVDESGNIIFSEIARLAGIAYTDWSWSALFGDYDNDGFKDIMITNGYPKALNNFDYLRELVGLSMFGTDSTRKQREYESMDALHGLKTKNYFFRNEGNLRFSNTSEEWGFTEPTYSYGAIQADLDNDGDLDVVINNTNSPAGIFKNTASSTLENNSTSENYYLAVSLSGSAGNLGGIGAKLMLTVNGKNQHEYFSPFKGYQSSTDHSIHFGLGSQSIADSLKIIWPDGRFQRMDSISANQKIVVRYEDATKKEREITSPDEENVLLSPANGALQIDHRSSENEFVDFDNEPLLPEMLSRLGPPIAVGDVNNDHLEDIYVGGAAGSPGILYLQQENGTLEPSPELRTWTGDAEYEDIDAAFFDANGNGLLDLYVVSGGNEFSPASAQLQDRLYLNSGDGRFVRSQGILPTMYSNGSVVKPADIDNDGDIDLFIGGRTIPGLYPQPAKSYILRNDGDSFVDVTENIAPDLLEQGIITDAVWLDFDKNGYQDLITTGLWTPISFYENQNVKFENTNTSTDLSNKIGWWYSIEKGDIDNDDDLDLIVGNLGFNHTYSTPDSPDLHFFAGPISGSQNHNAVLAIQKENEYYLSLIHI